MFKPNLPEPSEEALLELEKMYAEIIDELVAEGMPRDKAEAQCKAFS